jgi:hypothetical protein
MDEYCRVGQDTGGNKIWRMRIAHWLHKATNTPSEYVILLELPLRQYLHELPSQLGNTCIARPVTFLHRWKICVRNDCNVIQITVRKEAERSEND